MRSLSLNLSLTALITFCAWGCAALGQANMIHAVTPAPAVHAASHSANSASRSARLRLCSVFEDHVYLTGPNSATAVDVTKTLYVVQGQTYAVLNGVSIAIVLDHADGLVFDTNGRGIGYILRIAEPAVAPAAVHNPNVA